MQIGRLGRDGVERRPEGVRQAHHRAVQVESRQGLALGEHLVHALQAPHQRLQRRVDLDQHPRAARRDQGRIAAELQHVAEALFGVQQDGLAVQLLVAAPERRVESAALQVGAHVAVVPARLEQGKALGIVAEAEVGEAAVGLDLGRGRIQRDRPLEALHRLGQPAQAAQGVAAVAVGARVVRLAPQHLVIADDRLLRPGEVEQGVAAVQVRVGEVGRELQRRLARREGRLIVPRLALGARQVAARDRIGGGELHRRRQVLDGLLRLAGLDQHEPAQVTGHGVVGIGGDRFAERLPRLGQAALLQVLQAGLEPLVHIDGRGRIDHGTTADPYAKRAPRGRPRPRPPPRARRRAAAGRRAANRGTTAGCACRTPARPRPRSRSRGGRPRRRRGRWRR